MRPKSAHKQLVSQGMATVQPRNLKDPHTVFINAVHNALHHVCPRTASKHTPKWKRQFWVTCGGCHSSSCLVWLTASEKTQKILIAHVPLTHKENISIPSGCLSHLGMEVCSSYAHLWQGLSDELNMERCKSYLTKHHYNNILCKTYIWNEIAPHCAHKPSLCGDHVRWCKIRAMTWSEVTHTGVVGSH